MVLSKLIQYIWRFYIMRSTSAVKVNYYRKQGVKIGQNCSIAGFTYASEPYLIEIGDHVAIADEVLFITHDGGLWCTGEDFPDDDLFGMIKIGNNVHIGMRCTFLPNTSIGNNCIVGAGSVVRGKFNDNSVIMGNPAQVVTTLSVQKFIYSQHPGRLRTGKIPFEKKEPIIKKHFGLK